MEIYTLYPFYHPKYTYWLFSGTCSSSVSAGELRAIINFATDCSNEPMESRVVNTSFMNLQILIQQFVWFLHFMLEDEVSLFHAKLAVVGTKDFIQAITLPTQRLLTNTKCLTWLAVKPLVWGWWKILRWSARWDKRVEGRQLVQQLARTLVKWKWEPPPSWNLFLTCCCVFPM